MGEEDTCFVYDEEGMDLPEKDTITDLVVSVNIPKKTFSYCDNLESVVLKQGCTMVGDNAFESCKKLKSVQFPEKGFMEIGEDAFYSCHGLSTIVFPKGMTTIGESAFQYSYNLKYVGMVDSISEIGPHAFRNCSSLRSIRIPLGVKKVQDSVFFGCEALRAAVLPEGTVQEMGEHVFLSCDELCIVEVPKSATKLSSSVFYDCPKLLEKALPPKVDQFTTEYVEDIYKGDINLFAKHRFDDYPLHRLIYQRHTKGSTDEVIQGIIEHCNKTNQRTESYLQETKDMYGLTPLDILQATTDVSYYNSNDYDDDYEIHDDKIKEWFEAPDFTPRDFTPRVVPSKKSPPNQKTPTITKPSERKSSSSASSILKPTSYDKPEKENDGIKDEEKDAADPIKESTNMFQNMMSTGVGVVDTNESDIDTTTNNDNKVEEKDEEKDAADPAKEADPVKESTSMFQNMMSTGLGVAATNENDDDDDDDNDENIDINSKDELEENSSRNDKKDNPSLLSEEEIARKKKEKEFFTRKKERENQALLEKQKNKSRILHRKKISAVPLRDFQDRRNYVSNQNYLHTQPGEDIVPYLISKKLIDQKFGGKRKPTPPSLMYASNSKETEMNAWEAEVEIDA